MINNQNIPDRVQGAQEHVPANSKPQEVRILQKLARSSLLKWALAAGAIFGGTKIYHDQVTQPALEERIVERNSPAKLARIISDFVANVQSEAVGKEEVVSADMQITEFPIEIRSDVVKVNANLLGSNAKLDTMQGKNAEVGGRYVLYFFNRVQSPVSIGKGVNAIMINQSFYSDEVAKEIKEGDRAWYLRGTLITFDRDESQKPCHFRITSLLRAKDNTEFRPMETISVDDPTQSKALSEAVSAAYDEVKKYQNSISEQGKHNADSEKNAQELVKNPEFIKKLQQGSVEIIFRNRTRCTGFKYDESTIITSRHCTDYSKIKVDYLNMLLPTGGETVKRKRKNVSVKEGEYVMELATESNEDIAVITFAKPLFRSEDVLKIARDPLALGETYILGHFWGYGKNEKWKMNAGKMSEYRSAMEIVGYNESYDSTYSFLGERRTYHSSPIYSSEPGQARVFIDIGVQHGNSGGPVVNTKGEVVGAVSRFSVKKSEDGRHFEVEKNRFRTPRLDATKIAVYVAKAKENIKKSPSLKHE